MTNNNICQLQNVPKQIPATNALHSNSRRFHPRACVCTYLRVQVFAYKWVCRPVRMRVRRRLSIYLCVHVY